MGSKAKTSLQEFLDHQKAQARRGRCVVCESEAAKELVEILTAMRNDAMYYVTIAAIHEHLAQTFPGYVKHVKKSTLQDHLQEHVRELWDAAKGRVSKAAQLQPKASQ